MTTVLNQFADLAKALRGPVLTESDPQYAPRCKLASARNMRRPAALAQVTGVADVQAAVRFARARDVPFTILAGGHEVDGWGLQDGALAIDLTPMDGVFVDAKSRTGIVQAGSRLGIMDRETAVHSLAVSGGTVSDTGVSGLTLGGGFGWLTRKYGATLDNLLAINAVTVDGDVVRAAADENPDLFWAMRGGGGNFAVATSYEFALHSQDPVILAGSLVHTVDQAPEFLRSWRDFMVDAPDEVGTMSILMRASGPNYPTEMHGQLVLATIVSYAGDLDEGVRVLGPLRQAITPLHDRIRPQPYTDLQQVFEGPLLPQNERRSYQKSGFLPTMPDAFIDEVMGLMESSPVPRPGERDVVTLCMSAMGGAFLRFDEDSAAMPRGNATFYWEAISSYRHEVDDADWAGFVELSAGPRLRALSGPQAYLNHNNVGSNDQAFIEWAYGSEKYARLRQIKAQWDPENVLHFNKNIPPATLD